MSDVIAFRVVNWLPYVLDRPVRDVRRQNSGVPGHIFGGCQQSDFPPGHFFFVDVHCLCDDIKIGLHVGQLNLMYVQHVQHVAGKCVYLVGNRGE